MPTEVRAELYAVGNTATVITDGYSFQCRNDAALSIVNGRVKATKFGVDEIGPSTVKRIREDIERDREGQYFDQAVEETSVVLYSDRTHRYVESTIQRIFTQEDYALYDTEDEIIYRIQYEDNTNGEYNLIGTSVNTVRKEDADEMESKIGTRYKPLVRINKGR